MLAQPLYASMLKNPRPVQRLPRLLEWKDYGSRMHDASFLEEMGLDEFLAAYERVSEACSVERIEAS
jgi:hypothetical protein